MPSLKANSDLNLAFATSIAKLETGRSYTATPSCTRPSVGGRPCRLLVRVKKDYVFEDEDWSINDENVS